MLFKYYFWLLWLISTVVYCHSFGSVLLSVGDPGLPRWIKLPLVTVMNLFFSFFF